MSRVNPGTMRWFSLLVLAASFLRGEVIVCLGDSLTAGYGLEESLAWPALIQAQRPAWKVINAGISGDTTAGGLRRLDWALKAKPTTVVLALGANDGLRGLDENRTKANLSALIAGCQSAKARVILAGMQLPTSMGPDYRERFAAIFPQLAAERSVTLLPFLLAGVAGHPELNQADGIHPTAEGQKIIAALVLPLLDRPTDVDR